MMFYNKVASVRYFSNHNKNTEAAEQDIGGQQAMRDKKIEEEVLNSENKINLEDVNLYDELNEPYKSI